MKINARHYVLVILSIVTVIFVILSYVFMYNKTVNQAVSYTNSTKEVEEENIKKQNEQNLIKMHDETEADRAKIHAFIIQEDKVVDFIEKMEKIGEISNTKLELSSITKDESSINAKIQINGAWSNAMTALMLIENIPLSISINNIRFNAEDTLSKGSKSWNLNLDIKALTVK